MIDLHTSAFFCQLGQALSERRLDVNCAEIWRLDFPVKPRGKRSRRGLAPKARS